MRHVLQNHPHESVPVSHAVEGVEIPSKENRLSMGRQLPEIYVRSVEPEITIEFSFIGVSTEWRRPSAES